MVFAIFGFYEKSIFWHFCNLIRGLGLPSSKFLWIICGGIPGRGLLERKKVRIKRETRMFTLPLNDKGSLHTPTHLM